MFLTTVIAFAWSLFNSDTVYHRGSRALIFISVCSELSFSIGCLDRRVRIYWSVSFPRWMGSSDVEYNNGWKKRVRRSIHFILRDNRRCVMFPPTSTLRIGSTSDLNCTEILPNWLCTMDFHSTMYCPSNFGEKSLRSWGELFGLKLLTFRL